MKSRPPIEPEPSGTNPSRGTIGRSMLGWIAVQLRSALRLSASRQLGQLSDLNNSPSAQGIAPPKTPESNNPSIHKNSTPGFLSSGLQRAELRSSGPTPALRPATPQHSANVVTREELKRELDTLRRLIESRK
jgi:hypothetical protein